jgi:hypothetical protein
MYRYGNMVEDSYFLKNLYSRNCLLKNAEEFSKSSLILMESGLKNFGLYNISSQLNELEIHLS